tara:strand:- start:300 stop:773 length:474 start_codon:yes stop_codon:yes gene_type:complete
MAYQKLQTERANIVVPSDTIDIFVSELEITSGTDTAGTSSELTDSTKNFNALKVKVGDVVHNTTDNTSATVTAIVGDEVLSISANIMAVGEAYKIFSAPKTTPASVLYVGTAGDVAVITNGGDEVTFTGVPAGTFIPVQVKRVKSTGTTASTILALR